MAKGKKGENMTENKKLFEESENGKSQGEQFDEELETQELQTTNSTNTMREYKMNELKDEQEYIVELDEPAENLEIKEIEDADGNKNKIKYLKTPLVIASVRILQPRTLDNDGKIIPPIEKLSKKTGKVNKYYTSKVEILYENSRYKSMVSHIRWWVNKDTLSPTFVTQHTDNIDMKYVTEITKLYWKFCDNFGYDKTQTDKNKILSQKKFMDELVGKKVKIKELTGIYDGESWTKLSIDSFIK
jgi:hypothetical protein